MLARCTRCRSTFVTDRFGVQKCPSCGTEVMIRDPNAPPPATPPPPAAPVPPATHVPPPGPVPTSSEVPPATHVPPSAPVPPAFPAPEPARADPYAPPSDSFYAPPRSDLPPPPDLGGPSADAPLLPWDRRAEIGLFPALFGTAKLFLFEPTNAFPRLHPERLTGLHLWILLTNAIPFVILGVLNWAMTDPNEATAQLDRVRGQLEGTPFEEYLPLLESMARKATFGEMLGTLPAYALVAFAGYYVFAAHVHSALWLFRRAHGGWDATRKSIAFASTPMLLLVVPGCGAIVGGLWTLGLAVVGTARAHRVSGGFAFFAVVGIPLLLGCCLVVALAALVASMAPLLGPVN